MVHIAKEGESFDAVVKGYEKLGAKREKILASNNIDEISYFKDGQLYLIEGVKLWIPEARRSYPFLSKPVQWSRISSSFGVRRHPLLRIKRRHDGYDMVAPYGSPVFAGQDGVITFAGWQGGYGNMIEIRHSNITTRYGHLSKVNVEVGQRVKRRQLIGRVGSTGISTGPHLHFEVRRNSDGKAVRPGKYLY
jgi:murein DD-endopeptidase MepM/ murein hydrolase activator NlpD